MTEELADLDLADVVQVKLVIEPETLTARTDRHARDHRDLVATVAMADDRCLSARGPRSEHVGDQEEPRFVAEYDVGAQPSGVFFTLGQTWRFHRRIASSSRSMARRSGFWWLQPMPCISRPT